MPTVESTSSTPRFRTMHEHVIDALGLEIVSGSPPQGGTLEPEPVLSERLGVSRGALREAVKALAAKGLIAPRPKTGTMVLPMSSWNLLDVQVLSWLRQSGDESLIVHLGELRKLIEPGAAAIAAERSDSSQHATLMAAYEAMAQATAANDRIAYDEADVAFHQALLAMTGNPLLVSLSATLETALRISFDITSQAPDALPESLPMHLAIAKAVLAGKPDVARKKMDFLLATSSEHYSLVRTSAKARSTEPSNIVARRPLMRTPRSATRSVTG